MLWSGALWIDGYLVLGLGKGAWKSKELYLTWQSLYPNCYRSAVWILVWWSPLLVYQKQPNVPLFFGSYFLLIMHVFHHTLNPHPFWCHTFYYLFFFFMFFFNSTLHSCMESATSNPWNFQRGLTRVLEEEIVEQWLSSVKRVPGSVK